MKQKIKDFWRKEGLFTIVMVAIAALGYWVSRNIPPPDTATRILLGICLGLFLIVFFSAVAYFARHKEKLAELRQIDLSKPFEATASFFRLFFPEEPLEEKIERREKEKRLKELEGEIARLETPESKAEGEKVKLAEELKIAEQWEDHQTEERLIEIKARLERKRRIEQEIELQKKSEMDRILKGRGLDQASRNELEEIQKTMDDL